MKQKRKMYRGALIINLGKEVIFFLPRGDDFLKADSESDAKRRINLALGTIPDQRRRNPFL